MIFLRLYRFTFVCWLFDLMIVLLLLCCLLVLLVVWFGLLLWFLLVALFVWLCADSCLIVACYVILGDFAGLGVWYCLFVCYYDFFSWFGVLMLVNSVVTFVCSYMCFEIVCYVFVYLDLVVDLVVTRIVLDVLVLGC